MRNLFYAVPMLALTACTSIEASEEATSTSASKQSTEWNHVAPGVWERTAPSGKVQRRSFGLDGLRAVLDRARNEHAQLQAASTSGSLAATHQLTKNRALIADLERALVAMEKDAKTAPIATLADPDVTGEACGGFYGLGVEVTLLSFVDFQIEASAGWTEFGPFGPGARTLGTYTNAIGGDNIPREDADAVGPFSGTCCASVSSSSVAALTFVPTLYGLAYVHITDGCSYFDAHEET